MHGPVKLLVDQSAGSKTPWMVIQLQWRTQDSLQGEERQSIASERADMVT